MSDLLTLFLVWCIFGSLTVVAVLQFNIHKGSSSFISVVYWIFALVLGLCWVGISIDIAGILLKPLTDALGSL